MDSRDETPDEGIFVELREKLVRVEIQLGIEHAGGAFGLVGIRDVLGILDEVEFRQHHHFYWIDLQDDGKIVAIHLRIVFGGFQSHEFPEGVADVQLADGGVVHVLHGPVTLDEFRRLGPAVLMGNELGKRGVDVEVRVPVRRIDLREDQAPLEIARRALHVVLREVLGSRALAMRE
jgi:hypothetical protein